MKQFLPFLTDDQGRSLDVQNAVVITQGLPTPLENAPQGWEENVIQFSRNNEFRGVIKSYTTPLKFYLEGATILRNAFYRFGMEVVIFFIWLKLDQSFGGGMQYRGWYKGEVDFATYKDEWDGVTANVTEGGFYKDLQANKNVLYEIPFDQDMVQLYDDGLILHNKANYTLLNVSDAGGAFVGYENLGTLPVYLSGQEGSGYGLTYLPVNQEQIGTNQTDDVAYMAGSGNWAVSNDGTIPITFPVSGHIDYRCIAANPVFGPPFDNMYFKSSQGTQYDIEVNHSLVQDTDYTVSFSLIITLQPGEKLFSFRYYQAAAVIYAETTAIAITATTRMPATIINCYRAFDLGNKLVGKVSPGATLTSPLLQPDFNILCTSGNALRSLPAATIKTKLSDWYKSIDAVKCATLSVVNNNPVVSSRYDSFNTSTIATLGACSNWSLQPAEDYIYDTVEVGYPAKDANSNIDVNGKYSFNNTSIYKIDITRRETNAYSAKSIYYADPFDIELTRVTTDGKDTTTANTDNSMFFFDAELKTNASFTGTIHFYHSDNRIEFNGDLSAILPYLVPGAKVLINGRTWTITAIIDIALGNFDIIFSVSEYIATSSSFIGTATVTGLYQLRRPTYTTVNGIPNDGSVYNIELSPARIIKNHYRWLRSSSDHLDAHYFKFQTTDKNKDLQTIDPAGNTVTESADILVGSMGAKVYLPYYETFEIKSPTDLLTLMGNNPGGAFDYSWNGVTRRGFPIDIKTEETHLETQQYKVLQDASNNNLLLINNR